MDGKAAGAKVIFPSNTPSNILNGAAPHLVWDLGMLGSPSAAGARDPEPHQSLKLRPNQLLCVHFLLSPPSCQVKYKVILPAWAGTRRLAEHWGWGRRQKVSCTQVQSAFSLLEMSFPLIPKGLALDNPGALLAPSKNKYEAAPFHMPLNSTVVDFHFYSLLETLFSEQLLFDVVDSHTVQRLGEWSCSQVDQSNPAHPRCLHPWPNSGGTAAGPQELNALKKLNWCLI